MSQNNYSTPLLLFFFYSSKQQSGVGSLPLLITGVNGGERRRRIFSVGQYHCHYKDAIKHLDPKMVDAMLSRAFCDGMDDLDDSKSHRFH
jgi:hypothetical protein